MQSEKLIHSVEKRDRKKMKFWRDRVDEFRKTKGKKGEKIVVAIINILMKKKEIREAELWNKIKRAKGKGILDKKNKTEFYRILKGMIESDVIRERLTTIDIRFRKGKKVVYLPITPEQERKELRCISDAKTISLSKLEDIHIIPTTDYELITFYGKDATPETEKLISKEVTAVIEKLRGYIPEGKVVFQYSKYPLYEYLVLTSKNKKE